MSVLPPAETERHRTVTWQAPIIDVAKIASMSGLEYLQHLIDADFPPPIAELLNFRLSRIGPGVAVFAGTPAEYHYNPIGVVHGGFAATLLDSALGCAVHTTLKPGFAYTTVELKVNYVRPLLMSPSSRHLASATCRRSPLATGAMVWNTPSCRTSAWKSAAARWSKTTAKNKKAR